MALYVKNKKEDILRNLCQYIGSQWGGMFLVANIFQKIWEKCKLIVP